MNRQFKFRAWHSGWKRFIYFNGLKLNWSAQYGFFIDGQPIENVCYHCFDSKDVVIHQWTGLKDKFGKDVFEGDILEIDNTVIGYVAYLEENTCFTLRGHNPTSRLDLYLLDEPVLEPGILTNARTHKISEQRLKIIGNVVETPELLKD